MKKIFLLCAGLGCGLISSTGAVVSEKAFFPVDVEAAKKCYRAVPHCSEEEMARFIRQCPYQTRREFYLGEFDWDYTDANRPLQIKTFDWDHTDANRPLQTETVETHLLAVAIKGNCFNIVKYLLEKGASLIRKDTDNLFPIHTAVLYGSLEIVTLLLNRGVFIMQVDASGKQIQPLHLATQRNSTDMVEFLLSRGAGVEVKTADRNTPVHWAVSGMFFKGATAINMIDELINAKANVNAQNNHGDTPLHLLMSQSSPFNSEVATKLISAGADINIQNVDKNTPLHLLAFHISRTTPEFVLQLINDGVNVNIQNVDKNTPLHLLATQNSPIAPKVAKILIDNGAYLRLRNKKGDTVFDVARKHNNRSLMDFFETTILAAPNCSEEEFSRFLKECSPEHANHFDWGELDVNAEIPIKLGKVIFMESWLNIATKAGCPNIVQYLIDRGADVNRVDSVGATPIYTAICNGFTEIVGILINNGADIKQKFSPTGIQPLHCAVINNFSEIVKLLLFYNADVNAEIVPESTLIDSGSHNSTALHLSMFNANRKESIEVIRTLLENGADATAQDRKGNTPLHILLTNSRGIKMSILHEITKMLLANRDVKMKLLNLKNKDGKTICDIAKKTENQELISLL